MFTSFNGSEDLFKQETEIWVVWVIADIIGVVSAIIISGACQQAGGLISNIKNRFQKIIFNYSFKFLAATLKTNFGFTSTVNAVIKF